jgi:hypothetical protein
MIKTIIKLAAIGAGLYGIYYLASMFPVESTIIVGIALMIIVAYWFREKGEK